MNNCIYSINLLLFLIVLPVKLIVTELTITEQEKNEIVAWSLDQIFIFITLNRRLSFKKKLRTFVKTSSDFRKMKGNEDLNKM